MKRECFFVHVYFSNETVSKTAVTIGPMKMFRLEHETMNVCQTNGARFVHMVCRFDKISYLFRILDARCQLQRVKAQKVNQFGRTYHTGVALDEDMRSPVIDRILQEGGD